MHLVYVFLFPNDKKTEISKTLLSFIIKHCVKYYSNKIKIAFNCKND